MFAKKDVLLVLEELKKHYPCFVSERHLQTSFIIKAAELFTGEGFEFFPEFSPSLEELPENLRFKRNFEGTIIVNNGEKVTRDVHLDLFIKSPDNRNTIIEFKYKTMHTKEPVFINKQRVLLSDQEDTTNGRYSVWADIYRIEQFVLSGKLNVCNGYSVFITNYGTYLAEPKADCLSKRFSLNADSGKKKTWLRQSGKSVTEENQSPLSYVYKYPMKRDAFNLSLGFDILLTEVPSSEKW